MASRRKSGVISTLHAGAGKGIVVHITGDGESAKRALQMVQDSLKRLEEESQRAKDAANFDSAFNMARSALAVGGLTLSVQAMSAAIRSVVGDSLSLGQELEKASKRTGMQVESLSVLHYATTITGDSFEALTGALSKMNNTIAKAADGDTKAAAMVRALGLNAQELTKRTDGAEVAFHALVNRLAATENPLERTRLAMGLLGRSGAEQIPVLMQVAQNWDVFKQKAQEAGVLLDSETAKKLADTEQRLNDLKQHAVGAGLAFSEGLAPALGQVFSIISNGQGSMEMLTHWGELAGKGIAFVAEVAYSAAAALELMFSAAELGDATDAGRRDHAAAEGLKKQAQQFHDVAFGKTSTQTNQPFLPGSAGGARGEGFEGAPVAGKSDNPIAQAAAALAQEQAKALADATRASDQAQLSELETQHKLLLISDAEYYQRKFDLADEGFAAEQRAITEQTHTLEELQKRQHADPRLKRNKEGNSAEELKTAREILQLKEKQVELDAKQSENASRYTAETGAMNNAAELAGLRAAAELERERNSGITAQIALIQREHELEAQKSTLAGGTSADAQNIRDAGALALQKLQLQQIEQNITQVEQDHRRAVEDTNDAVEKGDMTKREAAQRTREANAAELDQLRQLVAQYDALAQKIGDPTLIAKAKDLDEQITTLGRTDRRGTFGKEIQDGLQGITTLIVDAAARGKQSFADMARSILDDLDRLALKMAEEKFLIPLFEGAFSGKPGSGAPASAGNGGGFGGAFGTPSISGLASQLAGGGGGGASVYKPDAKSGGGFFASAAGMVGKVASAALGNRGKQPNVTANVINNTPNPVTAGAPDLIWDTEQQNMVISLVLNNQLEGGALSPHL